MHHGGEDLEAIVDQSFTFLTDLSGGDTVPRSVRSPVASRSQPSSLGSKGKSKTNYWEPRLKSVRDIQEPTPSKQEFQSQRLQQPPPREQPPIQRQPPPREQPPIQRQQPPAPRHQSQSHSSSRQDPSSRVEYQPQRYEQSPARQEYFPQRHEQPYTRHEYEPDRYENPPPREEYYPERYQEYSPHGQQYPSEREEYAIPAREYELQWMDYSRQYRQEHSEPYQSQWDEYSSRRDYSQEHVDYLPQRHEYHTEWQDYGPESPDYRSQDQDYPHWEEQQKVAPIGKFVPPPKVPENWRVSSNSLAASAGARQWDPRQSGPPADYQDWESVRLSERVEQQRHVEFNLKADEAKGNGSYLLQRTNNYLEAVDRMGSRGSDGEVQLRTSSAPSNKQDKADKVERRNSIADRILDYENNTAPPPPPPMPAFMPTSSYVRTSDPVPKQGITPKGVTSRFPVGLMNDLENRLETLRRVKHDPRPILNEPVNFIDRPHHQLKADTQKKNDLAYRQSQGKTQQEAPHSPNYESKKTLGKAALRNELAGIIAKGPPLKPSFRRELIAKPKIRQKPAEEEPPEMHPSEWRQLLRPAPPKNDGPMSKPNAKRNG